MSEQPTTTSRAAPARHPATWISRVILFVLGWWILLEGRIDGLWFVLPVLVFAVLVRRALPLPLSLRGIDIPSALRFLPVFLHQSLAGGFDVAWRAFHPRLPLEPDIHVLPCRLQSEGAKVFLAQTASLLPGTLACEVGENELVFHALSGSPEQVLAELAKLEEWTARIFRENTEPRHG